MANFRNRYYTHRKRNRYYSHGHTSQEKTIRTGYAKNPEIVLQKIEKQRKKLTGSTSDSSSDRISLSQLFSFSMLLVYLQCIFLSTVL